MVGRPYSEEFRRRVLEEVAEGNSRRGAARRFKVGASSAIRWKKRLNETGSAAAVPRAGKSRSPLEAHAPWLLAQIGAEPDLSLAELTQRVQTERGQKTSASAMDRFVQRHGLSFKKRMARPVCKGFFKSADDQSAATYPASEDSSQPRWRYARSGPHKTHGVERRFLNQASGAPIDCQAISLSPLANLIDRSARFGSDRPTTTPPRAVP